MKILSSLNINLFPEVDANWYIQNTSEKHSSMEFHTYKSMAIFCMSHRFQHHELNSCGDRREIVIKSKLQQKIEDFINVYVTPLKVYSGDVKLDDSLKLDIQENPPEQEVSHPLIPTVYPLMPHEIYFSSAPISSIFSKVKSTKVNIELIRGALCLSGMCRSY